MRPAWISAAVLFCVLSTGLQQARGESFSLDRVYGMVRQRDEAIRIAREDLSVSEQEKNRARSALLPKVTLNANYTRYPEKDVSLGPEDVVLQPRVGYGMEAKLVQPLYSGGRKSAGLRIAKTEIEVAKMDLNLSTEDRLLETASRFYGVLKAKKGVEAENRNVERLTEHRRLSELRFKVGEVTETVLLRAEAELAGAKAEQVAAENNLAVQRKALQILAGLPDDFDIEEPPLPELPADSEQALLEIALKNREDVSRSRLQEEIGQDGVSLANGNFLPTVSLEALYFRRNQDPQSTFFIDESWYVGGKVEFTLFEGGIHLAERAQARSRLEQNRLNTTKMEKSVDLDVTRASLNLKAVSRELESLQDKKKFAEENYASVSRQFTFGLVTNIDLLDANQILIDADKDLIEATYNRHLAILDLQRSTGTFVSRATGGGGHSM
jgi:outer membrane protein